MSICVAMWYWFREAEVRNGKEVQPLGFSSHPELLKCSPGCIVCSRVFEVYSLWITAFKEYNHLFHQNIRAVVCRPVLTN